MPPADNFDAFADAVTGAAPDLATREAVLAATDAVLTELGRAVSGGAARELAEALPSQVAGMLAGASAPAEGEGGDSGAFFAAVAARERVDPEQAAAHVSAVFRAVVACAGPDAVRPVRDQLTPELRELFISEREAHVKIEKVDGPVPRTPPGPDERPAFPPGSAAP